LFDVMKKSGVYTAFHKKKAGLLLEGAAAHPIHNFMNKMLNNYFFN